MAKHPNPITKSLAAGKVKKMPDGSYKRVMPRPPVQTKSIPRDGSVSSYVAETNRRRAEAQKKKRYSKERNRIAKLAGKFSNTTN